MITAPLGNEPSTAALARPARAGCSSRDSRLKSSTWSSLLYNILMQGLPPYQLIDLHTLVIIYDHVAIRKPVWSLRNFY